MSTSARVLLLIVDGLGDVTVPQLGNRTPLQAASTPWLDAVAAGGVNGLMDPVHPGLACGSDTAHLSLLGYDPQSSARGRGAFEALGAGLDLRPGDVAFKANFAVVDDATRVVTQRRADRHFEDDGRALSWVALTHRCVCVAQRRLCVLTVRCMVCVHLVVRVSAVLCAALDGLHVASADGGPGATVHVRYATEHRAGVLLRGPMLCDRITGTGAPTRVQRPEDVHQLTHPCMWADPLKDNRPLLRAQPLDDSPEAAHTAHMVNQARTRVCPAHVRMCD